MSGCSAGVGHDEHATHGTSRGALRIAQHGRAMTMERFAACAGLEACLRQVAGAAARMAGAPGDRWILGEGVRIEGWREQRYPTASELDEVSGAGRCASGRLTITRWS